MTSMDLDINLSAHYNFLTVINIVSSHCRYKTPILPIRD